MDSRDDDHAPHPFQARVGAFQVLLLPADVELPETLWHQVLLERSCGSWCWYVCIAADDRPLAGRLAFVPQAPADC